MNREFFISIIHSFIWSAVFLIGIPLFIIRLFNIQHSDNIFLIFSGFMLIASGTFICLRSMYVLSKRKGTTTIALKAESLVREDIYSIVRNPIYLGVLIILLGELLLFPSLYMIVYLLLLFLSLHLWLIFVEEPFLERLFGDEFRKYKKEVPRWCPKVKKFYS